MRIILSLLILVFILFNYCVQFSWCEEKDSSKCGGILPKYTIIIDGKEMEKSEDAIPYIRREKNDKYGKPVVPLDTFFASITHSGMHPGIDKFDKEKQTVYFHYNLMLQNKFRIIKIIWNLKTDNVSVKIYKSTLNQDKTTLITQYTKTVTHGYYGAGWNCKKNYIWVPVIDLAKILFGEQRKEREQVFPTCIDFYNSNTVMIFTDAICAPYTPY